ncbi:MAG: N-acetyltransferase [Lachnospiraceae bacterium]|nr:N-acetyltransferase [Lachnospiraceae bacterium]
MADIKIRLEEVQDYHEVELVARAAFYRDERIKEIGVGCTEHYMIHELRNQDGIKELNFVAVLDDKIVGHVIYSHSYILKDDGERIETLNFGPLSVLPEWQKQGIGSMLMRFSIEKAKELGYGAIIFFGHPTYYPRFGFVEAKEFGITTAWGANYPAFMAMELRDGYLKNAQGKYFEADIYDEDITKEPSKEYDKLFSK